MHGEGLVREFEKKPRGPESPRTVISSATSGRSSFNIAARCLRVHFNHTMGRCFAQRGSTPII
jgi:hypothetical protein